MRSRLSDVSLFAGMMLVLTLRIQADILPAGDSDLLRWSQPGGPITAQINPDPQDPNLEPSASLGAFSVPNAFVIVQSAQGLQTNLAVLFNEGSLLDCHGGQTRVLTGCSDIVIWHTTGIPNSQQSITVDLISDSAIFNIGNATVLDNQAELLNGNDLSALFFTAAGRGAGFGLLAQSDVPEPTSVLLLGTVLAGLSQIVRHRRTVNTRC